MITEKIFFFFSIFQRTLHKASYIFFLFTKLEHFTHLQGFFFCHQEKSNLKNQNMKMKL